MKTFLALMCVLGTLLPYGAFIPWLLEHGPDLLAFYQNGTETAIGRFAWLDVVLSGVVLLVFIRVEGARHRMKHLYLPVLGTCLVGVSLGLPLFLLMREWQAPSAGSVVDS